MAIKTLTAFGGVRRIPGCARAGMKPNEIADPIISSRMWLSRLTWPARLPMLRVRIGVNRIRRHDR